MVTDLVTLTHLGGVTKLVHPWSPIWWPSHTSGGSPNWCFRWACAVTDWW